VYSNQLYQKRLTYILKLLADIKLNIQKNKYFFLFLPSTLWNNFCQTKDLIINTQLQQIFSFIRVLFAVTYLTVILSFENVKIHYR